ncbi:MAG: alanine racemase [Firmicutes bacterium]|nr:alanine racemase [Bacillota bacterium]
MTLREQDLDRAAWVEIDLAALRHNYRTIRRRVGEGPRLICVVKADAYGHGAVECAKVLQQEGAAMFAVATVAELRQLREGGVDLPTLILGHIPRHCYGEVLRLNGTFPLYSAEQAKGISDAAAAAGRIAHVHVKVDTGLTRLGFDVSEESAARCAMACSLPYIKAEAVYSHFAKADVKEKDFTLVQHGRFLQFIWLCQRQGLSFPWRHIANSAAICDLPDMWHEGARPGIILYGSYPTEQVQPLDLQPVMSVKARIVNLRTVPAGTPVSYAGLWTAERESRIAILPVGYADGLLRQLMGKMQVLIRGRRAPQLGLICMDQIMVDVTDIPDVALGDEAVVVGSQGEESIPMHELGVLGNTIDYEFMCAFRQRLPRVFRDGEPD